MLRCRHVCALAAAALVLIPWGMPLRAADAPPAYCPPSRRPVDFSGSEGRINDEMLAAFRAMVARDPRAAPVTNAVTRNSVKDLTVDRNKLTAHDRGFSHTIKTGDVTNQRASGRCWLFAGLNTLRPQILKKHNLANFEFSQNYSFFWDKLEKANLFLEGILRTLDRRLDDRHVAWLLKTPFPDGGQWNMVVDLIARYGVVPLDVMPDTKHSSGTGELNDIMSCLLRKDAARLRALKGEGKSIEELRAAKVQMLADVYRVLCYHFGEPPASFSWRFKTKDDKLSELKTYTPKSFYREFVGVDLAEYLLFYSCPAHEFGKLYRIEFDRDLSDGKDMTFANVPIDALKRMVLKQLLADEPVWFGCDVGQEHLGESGILRLGIHDIGGLLGIDLAMTKAERVLYRESIPTHAMVFMGVDLAGDTPVKWRVENSWGGERGDKGYLLMYDDWFDEYLYAALVHAKHVPDDVKAIFGGEPIVLPPWDPMYDGLR
ncbi:MAG TPA: aminopeptidase [Planctomycetes bacterium]|nr:aminopeptidase [Planctomycetota bacterium]